MNTSVNRWFQACNGPAVGCPFEKEIWPLYGLEPHLMPSTGLSPLLRGWQYIFSVTPRAHLCLAVSTESSKRNSGKEWWEGVIPCQTVISGINRQKYSLRGKPFLTKKLAHKHIHPHICPTCETPRLSSSSWWRARYTNRGTTVCSPAAMIAGGCDPTSFSISCGYLPSPSG